MKTVLLFVVSILTLILTWYLAPKPASLTGNNYGIIKIDPPAANYSLNLNGSPNPSPPPTPPPLPQPPCPSCPPPVQVTSAPSAPLYITSGNSNYSINTVLYPPKPPGQRRCLTTAYQHSLLKELSSANVYDTILPYTLDNMWEYGYVQNDPLYLFNRDIFIPGERSGIGRLPLFKKLLKKCDWVFYTDVDFLFIDLKKPWPISDEYDMIAGYERNNDWKLMDGTFILKSSNWSYNMLDEWWRIYPKYRNTPNHDQNAFQSMWDPKIKPRPKNVRVLAPEDFMIYDREPVGYYGVHFPSHSKPARVFNFLRREKPHEGLRKSRGLTTAKLIGTNQVLYQFPYKYHNTSHGIVFGVVGAGLTKADRNRLRKFYKNTTIFFVVEATKGAHDYDEFFEYNDVILLDNDDEDGGKKPGSPIGPLKTLLLLHALEAHISFKHLVKIDGVAMITESTAKNLIHQYRKDRRNFFIGDVRQPVKVDRNPNSTTYVNPVVYPSGEYPKSVNPSGYIISAGMVGCIVSQQYAIPYIPLEEYAMAVLGNRCAARYTHIKQKHIYVN